MSLISEAIVKLENFGDNDCVSYSCFPTCSPYSMNSCFPTWSPYTMYSHFPT